jgi:hypothetical protein
VAGGDALGALVQDRGVRGGLEDAGDIGVDAQAGGVVRVLRDPGVLADRQTEPPAVDVDHGRLAARGEADRLGRAQPHLAVGHRRSRPVDGEHRDVRCAGVAVHRRAHQRQRPGLGAGLDDRRQSRIIGADRRGVQLVPGQGELGKDDHPRARGANGRRVRRRVRGDVVRHARRLGDGDGEGLTHASAAS